MTTISFENDVCTEEQAKELKRLGIKQESFLYWKVTEKKLSGKWVQWAVPVLGGKLPKELLQRGESRIGQYSAFNTGELIAMHSELYKEYDLVTLVGRTNPADFIAERLIEKLNSKKFKLTVAEVNRRLDEFHKGK